MTKISKIETQGLREKNGFSLNEKAKAISTCGFWYYTRLHTADRILDGGKFHVSNFREMNDTGEAERHQDKQDFLHALCFCNSNSEKIPMWYLYSGISGNGASLGFTPSKMMTFLRQIKTVETPKGEKLYCERDFDMQFGWIYYRKTNERGRILYRQNWYEVDDPVGFESDNYFIKDYPWEYEREFRIVFINKTSTPYPYLVLHIPEELLAAVKIKLAPEITKSELEGLMPELPGFQKQMTRKTEYSSLQIKMGLCGRNLANILSYLEQELRKTQGKISSEDLCKIISKTGACGKQTAKKKTTPE